MTGTRYTALIIRVSIREGDGQSLSRMVTWLGIEPSFKVRDGMGDEQPTATLPFADTLTLPVHAIGRLSDLSLCLSTEIAPSA